MGGRFADAWKCNFEKQGVGGLTGNKENVFMNIYFSVIIHNSNSKTHLHH